ncbi:hypothetical protein FSP39_001655 [Pinctada imbricata]|uniref:SET domain-containing protein n=1 Tax=Pinctada imbricata TaxID=66713 RepID=A0AA88XWJ6_PINIB|nr:hypothetical protein FSP39_001655 [Pinctada imbricata]
MKSCDYDMTQHVEHVPNDKSLSIDSIYSIDATHSLDRLGRYVNDEAFGKPANNSVVKLKMINKQPRLCLFASRDIYEGEEIRYDYGDQEAPWRQRSVRMLDNVKVKQLNNFDESVTHVIVNTASDSSSSHEPQSSRSQQSSQEPQSSRSQQSSQEPQASSENFSFLE